jgi:hypothetical protein
MPDQPRRLVRPRPAEESAQEEEAPRRRLRRSEAPPQEADDDAGLAVAKGWAGYRRTKANAPSQFTKLFKVVDDEQLICFLEDGPYASFLQHWCDWVGRGQRQSYVCLQEDCPLDEVDSKPSARVRFNILDCNGDTPILVTFECGVSVTDALDKYAKDEPLAGRYFAVQMTGQKNNRRTQIRPIKVRDLKEDWDFEPLSEKDIEKFDDKLWDSTALEVDSRAELRKVADAFNE